MKKILLAALSLMLVIGMVACGEYEGGNDRPEGNIEEAKILQDIFDLIDPDNDVKGSSLGNNHYVMVFDYDDIYYRAWAEVSDELMDKIFDLDFFDPDRPQKERDLLKDLSIGELTNLSEAMPTGADLQKYVGKKGQDLIDEGFSCFGYSFWDDTVFSLDKGDYAYEVTMNEKMGDYDEDAEYEELLAPLTVKSIVCTGIGSGATDIFNDYD